MRYIILGNGVAGVTAARTLTQKSSSKTEILQFSDEPWGYYPRPKLPQFLEDSTITPNDVISYNKDWYKTSKIKIYLDEKIHKIDPEAKEVSSNKGVYAYDRLLLALGAHCACPPIPGLDLKNAFTKVFFECFLANCHHCFHIPDQFPKHFKWFYAQQISPSSIALCGGKA